MTPDDSDGPDEQAPPATPPLSRARTLLHRVGRGRETGLIVARRNPVRTTIVCAGLVLTVVAGSPLAVRGWEALWSLPHAGRLALCVVGLAAIGSAALWGVRLDLLQRAERARLGSVIAVAWMVVVAVVGLLVTSVWWVMGAPRPLVPDQLPPRALDAIATRAFAVVAGLGAAALLVISYRRQRTTEAENARAELAVERENTRLFNERFTAAYSNLGSEHAAVRLGAVHALASLADDAPSDDLVQMVIDVLCAYLRVPYRPAPEPLPEGVDDERREDHHRREVEFAAMREVRHTIIRIIGDRLREPTRWRGKDYVFTGAVFDGGNFNGAVFSGGRVDFRFAEFSDGRVTFLDARFSGADVEFGAVEFSGGAVVFDSAEFSGGRAGFLNATFSGGEVSFMNSKFSHGSVDFAFAEFSGGHVRFSFAYFSGGRLDYSDAGPRGDAVSFHRAVFSGGEVDFRMADFSSGWVYFDFAEFSGGAVRFPEARFRGGEMNFRGSNFSGSDVDFRSAEFSGGEMTFRDAEGACPEGLLDALDRGTPGPVVLPDAWRAAAQNHDRAARDTPTADDLDPDELGSGRS